MTNKKNIYWYCQIFGWSFFVIINSIFLGLSYQTTFKDYFFYFLTVPLGIAISHGYRLFIISQKILNLKIPIQLFLIILFSVIKAIVFFFVTVGLSKIFGLTNSQLSYVYISSSVINFTVVFCLWNVIYFGFQYFQNFKRTEINSLRYLAASKESELNSLKAQLNPHFMFNSMNSIRALIDENPAKAKVAITQLSNILRKTLLIDKGKEVLLKDEINLVKDYLNLEHIRYEERLNYDFKIAEDVENLRIPPFIIQTQVENAIKHGISKLPGNGNILIEAFKLLGILKIKVSNTGKLNNETPLTGIGFKNSIQRLELLYGVNGKIFINELNNLVVVEINIPLN
ncbi:MAG: histidine kinase [Bacteroidota bacterium]